VAYVTKIKNGTCEVYDIDRGNLVRRLGSDVVSAEVSGENVAITKKDGTVEVYNIKTGSLIRRI
jgi:hypothetical protein